MSDKEEPELRCGESFPRAAPKPRRSTATSARCSSPLLSGFSMELEARIWFAAPQRRYLRAMKTRPCAPGKINAPPRLTSQNISPAPFRLSLRRGQSFQTTDWKKKKRRNIELGRVLAAKIEFSYGAGQTVNLLALHVQLFESTSYPLLRSGRCSQVFKPFGERLGISSPRSDINPFPTYKTDER